MLKIEDNVFTAHQEKITAYLGFAQKAGKIISGDQMVRAAINSGKVMLVLIACDTAKTVQEDLMKACLSKKVAGYLVGSKTFFGHVIGKSPRGAVAIMDVGFAQAIDKLLK